MKFKLKILMFIFAITHFQNSIYSAEILKKAASNSVKFVKDVSKKILTDKKLHRNILKAAVIIIPITITFIKLTKRIKYLEANPKKIYVTKYVTEYEHTDYCDCDDCYEPDGTAD